MNQSLKKLSIRSFFILNEILDFIFIFFNQDQNLNFHSIFIFYFFQGPPPPRLYCSSCTPPLMFRFASTRLLLPRAEIHFDRLAGSPVYVTARLPAVEGNRSFFIRRESGAPAAQLWQEMDCGASSLTAAGGRWIGRSVKGEPGAT